LQAELYALPLEYKKDTARITREIDALEQELAEAEARRQIVLTAPQSGTVTTLQLEPGSNVKSTLPLLSIIPAGSELVAQLYIPTRAIGFIKPGQSVLLRYRAFPYQKFGHYQGTIAKVSRSTINSADLSAGLRGATDQRNLNEPVYPVTVHLANQSVNAYGQAIALQPGMELEADILIENRRLIEWVLEPLYTLTGKMQS
jgi:membrane fusion protein